MDSGVKRPLWRSNVIPLLVGIIAATCLVASVKTVNHLTSTDDFCGGACHVMQAQIWNDKVFSQSGHRVNRLGMVVQCHDCHLPQGFLAETWAHIHDGSKDLLALLLYDYDDPAVWQARLPLLAERVRDDFVANDSAACRHCHSAEHMQPQLLRGRRQHQLAQQQGVSCIGCHYNLVHQPVAVTPAFLSANRLLPDYRKSSVNP